MKVDRKKLLASLEAVSAGLAPKGIDQSDCFVFDGDRLLTFNDEVACSIDNPLPDVTGAIRGDKFLKLLHKMTADSLDIEAKDGEMLVKGKGERAGPRMENDITMPVEAIEIPDDWLPLHKEFCKAVPIMAACAGKDETHPQLICVHLHPKWLEATDRYQVIRYPVETGLAESVMVRADALRAVTDATECSVTESWIHFRSESGLTISIRLSMDEFPNVGNVFESEGVKTTLPKGLDDAVQKAELFSGEKVEDDYVEVRLGKSKLRLIGRGPSGWYERQVKAEYGGEPVSFMISAGLLVDVSKRASEVEIAEGRLIVRSDKYTFVACTGPSDDGEE